MLGHRSRSDDVEAARSWSLRAHFLFFGLILVLPLAVLAAFLIFGIAQANRSSLEQRMAQVAASVAADVDRELRRRITVLQTLSTSPALAQSDLAAFHA